MSGLKLSRSEQSVQKEKVQLARSIWYRPCRVSRLRGPFLKDPIGPAVRADFRHLYPANAKTQRAAQATTIAPRWQTLWRQHGPFGGTLARIFGPRFWRGRRTPFITNRYCIGNATIRLTYCQYQRIRRTYRQCHCTFYVPLRSQNQTLLEKMRGQGRLSSSHSDPTVRSATSAAVRGYAVRYKMRSLFGPFVLTSYGMGNFRETEPSLYRPNLLSGPTNADSSNTICRVENRKNTLNWHIGTGSAEARSIVRDADGARNKKLPLLLLLLLNVAASAGAGATSAAAGCCC